MRIVVNSLLLLFFIIVFFQAFYLIASIFLLKQTRKELFGQKIRNKKISVVIPVFNSEKTIGRCLEALLKNNLSLVDRVVIVLDQCSDNSASVAVRYRKKFRQVGATLEIISLSGGQHGKVAGLTAGFKKIKTKQALLLDSDIVITPKTLASILSCHFQNKSFYTTCLIYPYQEKGQPSLLTQIIHNDRLYRQNILQGVRSWFHVANHPGGIAMVEVAKYRRLLKAGFLEDLSATYSILASGEKIAFLNKPLAFEIERQSLRGVFWQRVRWTIGNLENIPLLGKSVMASEGSLKKGFILSYPVMWYLQHYATVVGLGLFVLLQAGWWTLLPAFFYLLQVGLSARMGRAIVSNSFWGVLAHCFVFPLMVTAALFGAITTIFVNRKFYFKTNLLFARI